jgi:hypothetical protein
VAKGGTGQWGCLGQVGVPSILSLSSICLADSVHPGAAADADRRQAEAVSAKPAANHAESNTVIRGLRIRSSDDLGGIRPEICTR